MTLEENEEDRKTCAASSRRTGGMTDSSVVHCCSCGNSAAASNRPATEEEEAWLQWEDRIIQALSAPASPSPSRDEETFNAQDEIAQWTRAEMQNYAAEEAEFIYEVEEEKEQQLLELAISKNSHQYFMMKSLIYGATFLTDIKALEEANLQDLTVIQQAAKALIQLVDDSMHARIEEERLAALNRCNKAIALQREVEADTAREKAILKAEISKLKRDYRDLNEKFEQEKDRSTCRICFTKSRDVLPLPCMHFDYCHTCLYQYQKMRNICPTCRSPISGVLRHNLSIS